MRILHFADAHINMANYGKQDPETGLPLRVLDFLKALDTIIAAAVNEKVDLVIFAGDAYKDRNPAPTFQREWGRRIMRLSHAGIPAVLLVGNHDLSPSLTRAHALEEFSTLEIEKVIVADRPRLYSPDDLWGLPLHLIALPWISRSGMVAQLDLPAKDSEELNRQLAEKLGAMVDDWLEKADPELPRILTAHASVPEASYGGERTVTLDADLTLGASLVKDPRLDYVAMGHIHKYQDVNHGKHPPVVYPGSIERVDWGEAGEDKYYIIAEVARGQTSYTAHKIQGIRQFIDRYISLESDQQVNQTLQEAMPSPKQMTGAIVRLTVDYPRDWESLIDDAALREIAAEAFEFHLVKRPQMKTRSRLPDGVLAGSAHPSELLQLYWQAEHQEDLDTASLQRLARDVIETVEGGEEE